MRWIILAVLGAAVLTGCGADGDPLPPQKSAALVEKKQ